MTALRDRKVIGARGSDGRVHVPPPEFDPATHEPMTDFVDVSDTGTVVSWSWMPEPIEGQPLSHPFAWALVKLDGADTSILHAVDAGSPGAMSTGMRVRVRWPTSAPAGSRTSRASSPVRAIPIPPQPFPPEIR